MEILVECFESVNACFYELYRDNHLVGQLQVYQNTNYDFQFECECDEDWVESYLMEYLKST